MKNQVNKKVSKILIALLALVIMSVSCVLLAACNKECTHSKITDGVDTATCTSGGFITHTCDDCGYTYMTATSAKAHTYDTAQKVAATCTEKGYTVATCTLCGYELKTDFVDALGHAETETTTTAATCAKDGNEIVKCKDCGMILNIKTLPATGHEYVAKTTVAATCGADGYTINECKVCGAQETVKGDAATGNHTFVTTSISAATCTAMGLKVERCEVCGLEHNEVLPTVAHTYSFKNVNATCTEKAHKEKVCDVCGDTVAYDYEGELAEHDYKTIAETFATCVTAGKKVEVCKLCGEEKVTDTPATGEHTYGEAGATVIATCTSEGYIPYTCTVCKTVMKKNVTAALGHEFNVTDGATVVKTVAATCTNAGYNIVKCARCDVQSTVATDEALGHDYVEEKVVAATCLAEGYTLKICSRCDLSKKTDIVAATGHDYQATFTKTATCTTDGEKLYDCTKCGAQKKEVLESAGHAWGDSTVIEATCTDPEYTYNTCTVCGTKSDVQETAPALSADGKHTFTQTVIEAANCYQTGIAKNACEVCGYEEEVVLGITEHTYYIADAIMGNDIAGLEQNYPTLYAKYLEYGNDYYCTVSAVTCTAAGMVIAKCDYCEVRYTAGTTAALGHNFEGVEYATTCYNQGYYVLECTRCHYEARRVDETGKGVRESVVNAIPHVMTVASSTEGAADLKLYAKNTADGLTIYTDYDCTTELPATDLCNVFAKDADNNHYVFYCDVCHAHVGEEYIAEASCVKTEYIYTDALGEKFAVYATSYTTVTDTKQASDDHVYDLVADATDSDALVCETERKEIYYCENCDAAYREYNKTALTLNEETHKYENNEGHYCDVAYVWHYHELPGDPKVEGYDFTDEDGTKKINTMTGAACTSDATYSYGCKVCGETLEAGDKVDKDAIFTSNIKAVYDAWLETLEEGEKQARSEEAFVTLTEAMMSSNALGHEFDVTKGATYVVKVYDATTNTFANRTCADDEVLVIAIACARCGELNYVANSEVDNIAEADKYDNVPHGVIDATALASGEFAWANVVYYAYDANGEWIANATAETEGAKATVLNPSDAEDAHECDAFTCGICENTVAQHHYGNVTVETVGCRQAQNCVFCGYEMKPKSHVEPAYTCYSIKSDGYYYCALCGAADDGVALGKVTPHNVTVALVTDATCTETGAWKITCACGADIAKDDYVIGLKGTLTGAALDMYNAYAAAIDAATTGTVTKFDPAWLTIAAKGHTPGEWTTKTDATCTTAGTKEKVCTVCGDVVETGTIDALGHTSVKAAGDPDDGVYSVIVKNEVATCTTQGVTTYKCGRCEIAMDGTNGTDDQTVTTPKLYHNITLSLKEGGKVNCVYGAELNEFACANCGKNDYAAYKVVGVLYQAKVRTYLAAFEGDIAAETWTEWTTTSESGVAGVLVYTAGEHDYTKFDTSASHGDKVFVKPTATTNGSAYWTCSKPQCQDRTYIENSVTLEQYYDPDINMDWANTAAKEEAMATVSFTVNGAANEALTAIATATYFDITAEGFVLKADKVADVVNMINDVLKNSSLSAGTNVTVAGTTFALQATDSELGNSENVSKITNALNGLKLTTALIIAIAY